MELEEAKEILVNIIDDEVIGVYCINIQKEYVDCGKNCEDKDCYLHTAIDTVLQELDRLQKENEELNCVKKAIKVYKTNVGTENCQFVLMSETEFLNSFNYKCLLDDYISKDKIREKIEEIKARMNDDCLALHEFQRIAKIDVLQDLLKEE